MSSFEKVYEHQLDMQVNVYGDGTPLDQFDDLRKIEFIKNNILATLDELHEGLAEVGWKPWASSKHINRDALKGELVDVLHFYINLLGVIGVTPDELFEAYFNKAAKNKKRQEDGYDGVSTKCPGCKRALDDDAVECHEVLTSEDANYLGIGINTFDPTKRVFFCSKMNAAVSA